MSSLITESEYLEHFGIRGMHWGQRKAKETSESPKRVKRTRKERKEAKRVFYDKKVNRVIQTAAEKPADTLVLMQGPSGDRYIMTGREFVMHVAAGGYFNSHTTDIYATRQGNNFVQNEHINETPNFKYKD